jgi:ADP-heptose:LPS heptosyltransferase
LLTSKEYINGINISGNKIDAITKYKKSRLIAWDGPLAEYCALISIADYHIGYDSSGQHIAAALGIPTVDIFVDPTNTESFINRWTPTSSARVEVLRLPQNNNVDTTVQLIIDAWKRLSLF